jgi:hypothetical protein
MATRKRSDVPSPPAFVFRGTVKKIGSATMKEVPVGDRTAVVHVDQVIEAPKTFAYYEGKDITVEIGGRTKVAAGDELIFHANSWIFGESVAVRSVTQERVTKTHAALLAQGGDPTERMKTRQMQEHIDKADLVVSGRVAAVTVPPEATQQMHGLAAPSAGPVSEHDPKWRQAVIDIDQTHKGSHDSKQVMVLFPASTDVRWYRAPKFQAGQKGLFVLHKTKIKTEEHHALRGLVVGGGPAEMEVYTALHPEDVHPLNPQAAITALIR